MAENKKPEKAKEESFEDEKNIVMTSKKTISKKRKIVKYAFRFIIFFIFAGIACAGGFIVGDLLIGKWDTFDPSLYSAKNYEESAKNIALWKSQSITTLSATKVFVVAQSKILECEYFSVYTKGYNGEDKGKVTTLGMTQDLYGYRYRDHNKGYFDYFSTGLATVVKKTEFTFSENKYYCFEGSLNGNTVDWKPFKTEAGLESRTEEEYKEMTGCAAENPIDHIVSTKTVLEEKSNGKVNGLNSYTLKLDVATSVLNYVVKMNYMSGFGYPKFTSIEIRFEVDDDMNFKNIYINESYKVIGMNANAKYKMEFCYDDIEIR